MVWQTEGSRSGFLAAVTFFGSLLERIPPAAHTYQRDVETVHRLIEDKCFDLETFRSRAEFLAKAYLYQLYFNLARPNSHKAGLSPWQIIHQLDSRLPLDLCLLPPVLLDYRLDNQRGYDLPRYPYRLALLESAALQRSNGPLLSTSAGLFVKFSYRYQF